MISDDLDAALDRLDAFFGDVDQHFANWRAVANHNLSADPPTFSAHPAAIIALLDAVDAARGSRHEGVREATFGALAALRTLAGAATQEADRLASAINRERAAGPVLGVSAGGGCGHDVGWLRASIEAEVGDRTALLDAEIVRLRGLREVAEIVRRHTHQDSRAMTYHAGPRPEEDCLLCRALVAADVLALGEIGAGTRTAILAERAALADHRDPAPCHWPNPITGQTMRSSSCVHDPDEQAETLRALQAAMPEEFGLPDADQEAIEALAADLFAANRASCRIVAEWMLERGWTEPLDDAPDAPATQHWECKCGHPEDDHYHECQHGCGVCDVSIYTYPPERRTHG